MIYVQGHKRCSAVFIVSFEHISYLFLVFLFVFEQVIGSWKKKVSYQMGR